MIFQVLWYDLFVPCDIANLVKFILWKVRGHSLSWLNQIMSTVTLYLYSWMIVMKCSMAVIVRFVVFFFIFGWLGKQWVILGIYDFFYLWHAQLWICTVSVMICVNEKLLMLVPLLTGIFLWYFNSTTTVFTRV